MNTAIETAQAMFESPLFHDACLTAILAGLLCGAIGPLVVWKRMSLVGDAISHASFAAIAIGVIFGFTPAVVLIPFSILLALALAWMEERNVLENDAVLAVFFSGLFAIGIILVAIFHNTSEDMVHFLLGDILTVTDADMLQLTGVLILVCSYLWNARSTLIMMILQPDLALVEGLKVRRHNYLLMTAIGLTVAVCLKLMGVILLTSLLTVPPLIARQLGGSLRSQWMTSLTSAVLVAAFGVTLSFAEDWPTGATIGALGFVLFLIASAVTGPRRRTV